MASDSFAAEVFSQFHNSEQERCEKAADYMQNALELLDGINGMPGIAAANLDLSLSQLHDFIDRQQGTLLRKRARSQV